MSLINEALKRAKKAQVRQPNSIAADPVLQPAVSAATGLVLPPWILPAAALAVLVFAIGLLCIWWSLDRRSRAAAGSRPGPNSAQTLPVVSSPHSVSASMAASTQVSNPTASAASNKITSATGADMVAEPTPKSGLTPVSTVAQLSPAPNSATNETVLHPAESESPPVPFKLQGIFFRTTKASALIDGQTLFVGDEIDGAKVIAIERQIVRLTRSGQPVVLKLR